MPGSRPVSTFFIIQSMFTCAATAQVLWPLTYSRLFTYQNRHDMILIPRSGLACCTVWFDMCYSLPACLNHTHDEKPVGNG